MSVTIVEKAWAWVRGSDGALIDGENIAATARTALGRYTVTLASGVSARFAQPSQYSDPAGALVDIQGCHVTAGLIVAGVVQVATANRGPGDTDTDFLVRFMG